MGGSSSAAHRSITMAPVLLLSCAVLLATLVVAAPNTSVISVLCNSNKYTKGDPFSISLAYVLNDLINNTPPSNGKDYNDISPYPNAFAYGHAACNAGLTASDCSDCLHAAVSQMNAGCVMNIGARCLLRDCTIRYEQYPFVR